MDINFNAKNIIHLANKSSHDILVIASSNKDWLPVDIGFSFVKTALLSAITSGGGASATVATAEKISTLSRFIKTANDLYSILSKLQKIYRTLDAVSQKHLETKNDYLKKMFANSSIRIAVGEYKIVNEKAISPFEGLKPLIPDSFINTIKENTKDETVQNLADMLREASVIPQVAANIWKTMDPSLALSVLSVVGDTTIFIATPDFTKMCTFNTNSDHSWIVGDDEIVRAKYMTILEEDRSAGWHIFSNTNGSSLIAGEYLEPHESLDIQTVNYESNTDNEQNTDDTMDTLPDSPMDDLPDSPVNVDEYPHDVNLINIAKTIGKGIGKVGEETIKKADDLVVGIKGATKTIGASPYKLIYQRDGNLVLYKISGDCPTAVWSSGTANRPAWRLCMQNDGNLVIYSAPNKVEWALWQEVPGKDLYEGAFIVLDKVSGRIAYFKKGMDSPEFFINDKDDCYLANT